MHFYQFNMTTLIRFTIMFSLVKLNLIKRNFLKLSFLVLSLVSVGCAKVEFDEQTLQSNLEKADHSEGPEVFEIAVSGVTNATDQFGEVYLSASITAVPTMEIAIDNMGENTLTTGFTAIVASFE